MILLKIQSRQKWRFFVMEKRIVKNLVTAKVLKAITAALNLMLWLPMKAVDAIQFALAPADPVTFNTRKLRRKRTLCFVRLELPSGK